MQRRRLLEVFRERKSAVRPSGNGIESDVRSFALMDGSDHTSSPLSLEGSL